MESYGFDNLDPFHYLLNLASETQLETIRQLLKLDPEDDLYSKYTIDRDTETLELIASILNLSTYRWTSRGYTDAIDCIFIAPFNTENPISPDDYISTVELESYAPLFDAYAWGNVYGYQTLSTKTEDSIVDSCYGFYGED
jgi:hypothetical protein